MRELASIERIEKLTGIEGKDRIELASIQGWEVIVQKGLYKEGDLVVYIEYDTLLPVREEFEFLRSRCYSPKYDMFRIRNMKMGDVFSQGIVFPIDILPKGTNIKEGVAVAKILGIKKYDPEEFVGTNQTKKRKSKLNAFLFRFKIVRKLFSNKAIKGIYPDTVEKSDETNIQKIFTELKNSRPNEGYYLTEKLEGQSSTFMLFGKKRKPTYMLFSHNAMRQTGDGSNWDVISKEYNIEKLLRKVYKETKIKYAIQGEIVGPGIQKNIYGLPSLKLYVFKVTNVDTGVALDYSNLVWFCEQYSLPMVPVLDIDRTLPDSVKDVLDESNGKSVLADHIREGIVWRSMKDQRIGFKARSPEYLMWWDKKD